MPVKARPGFQTNVDRTIKGTAKKSVYFDIAPGQTVLLRFTPSSRADGDLFFESSQHFKFTHGGEKRAFACINIHKNEKAEACPICEALEKAEELLDKAEVKKLNKAHRGSNRWHAQIVVVPAEGAEKPTMSNVIGLSQTTAQKIARILKRQKDMGQPLLNDVDNGEIISIERIGTGFDTEYDVQSTGVRVPLDKVFPGWEEKFLDVEKALKLRVEDRATLIESLSETFGPAVFGKLGVK